MNNNKALIKIHVKTENGTMALQELFQFVDGKATVLEMVEWVKQRLEQRGLQIQGGDALRARLYDKDFDEYIDCLPTDNVLTMAKYNLAGETDDDVLVASKCQMSNNGKKKASAEFVEKTCPPADITTSFVAPTAANRAEPEPPMNPKPAKMMRTSTPVPAPATAVQSRANDANILQVPSIISKVLPVNGGHLPTENPRTQANSAAAGNDKKASSSLVNTGQKRVQKEKEKKSQEKKVSDAATKGGYTNVNIEHLFNDKDPKAPATNNANATDEEHSEGDSAMGKEELPKITKGIPQPDLELPPMFYTTKPSSKLGLVLHKAESESRDFQAKVRSQQQIQEGIGEEHLQRMIVAQSEVANKRKEVDQEREIEEDIKRKILEGDKRIKARESTEAATTKRDSSKGKRSTDKADSRSKRHSDGTEDLGSKNVKRERKSEERSQQKIPTSASRPASSAK